VLAHATTIDKHRCLVIDRTEVKHEAVRLRKVAHLDPASVPARPMEPLVVDTTRLGLRGERHHNPPIERDFARKQYGRVYTQRKVPLPVEATPMRALQLGSRVPANPRTTSLVV
jgi:hypothetical protein